MNKRPRAVTVLAGIYIAVGTIGAAYHFPRTLVFRSDDVWVELTELLALACGIFLPATGWISFLRRRHCHCGILLVA